MDGILLVDKPADIGSAEVVRQFKRLVKPAKIGHLGTLDPFATGLLPILIGEATKIAQFLEHHDKRYAGVIALGAETDTLDRTGQIVRSAPVGPLDPSRLEEVARQFTGQFEQVPPVYSAIKRSGVPLYKLARKGMEPAPPDPRVVVVKRLELWSGGADRLGFSLQCATGMYVRALARDIGNALGTVGHLAELRREATGGFSIDQAHPLERAAAALAEQETQVLVGLNQALGELPAIEADLELARRVRNGDASALLGMVRMGHGPVKVVRGEALVAIAQFGPDGRLGLARVFGN
jgi:tRNA pseudouridine55 synthase